MHSVKKWKEGLDREEGRWGGREGGKRRYKGRREEEI